MLIYVQPRVRTIFTHGKTYAARHDVIAECPSITTRHARGTMSDEKRRSTKNREHRATRGDI